MASSASVAMDLGHQKQEKHPRNKQLRKKYHGSTAGLNAVGINFFKLTCLALPIALGQMAGV